jgi:LPS-assembly lipoprotein
VSVLERTRLAAAVCLTALTAGLASCGFHLQGASPLPDGNRRIFLATSDELTPFAVQLRNSINGAGGNVVTASKEADTVVRITHDRSGRRVLSVSARNTPQEYELFYEVEYSVDRAGQEVVEPQPLELIRNLNFDETKVLAKDREEAILRDAMAKDLALLVLRRLESLPPTPATPAETAPATPPTQPTSPPGPTG